MNNHTFWLIKSNKYLEGGSPNVRMLSKKIYFIRYSWIAKFEIPQNEYVHGWCFYLSNINCSSSTHSKIWIKYIELFFNQSCMLCASPCFTILCWVLPSFVELLCSKFCKVKLCETYVWKLFFLCVTLERDFVGQNGCGLACNLLPLWGLQLLSEHLIYTLLLCFFLILSYFVLFFTV